MPATRMHIDLIQFFVSTKAGNTTKLYLIYRMWKLRQRELKQLTIDNTLMIELRFEQIHVQFQRNLYLPNIWSHS